MECEYCGKKKTPHDKGLAISEPPYLLQLQLKRFIFNPYTMAREKLDDRVTFPLILDLNPFVEKQRRADGGNADTVDHISADAERPMPDSSSTVSVVSNDAPITVGHISSVAIDTAPASSSSAVPCPDGIDLEASESTMIFGGDPVPPTDLVCGNDSALDGATACKAAAVSLPPPSTDLVVQAAELVKLNGPHVYELYSVLVHSGSANGGHYYAYIMVLYGGVRLT